MYQKNITIWDEYYPAESVEEDIVVEDEEVVEEGADI